jgi:hypothetical protein
MSYMPGALPERQLNHISARTNYLSESHTQLVLRDGEGHLGIYDHLGEMLDALTEPDTAD